MDFSLGKFAISITNKADNPQPQAQVSGIEIREGNVQEQTDCEAIVNAANRKLKRGTGVCGAIFSAADAGLLEAHIETVHPNGCPCGDAVVTPAFGLEASGIKHIIHAVGPKYFDYPPDLAARRLAQTYQSVFLRCKEMGIKSVAIPAISTGVYAYPVPEAAAIAVEQARQAQMFYPELKIVFVIWADKIPAFQAALDGTNGPTQTPADVDAQDGLVPPPPDPSFTPDPNPPVPPTDREVE